MGITRFATYIALMSAIVPVAVWTWEDALTQGIDGRPGQLDPSRIIDISEVLRIDESATNDSDDAIQARDQPGSDYGARLRRPENSDGVK